MNTVLLHSKLLRIKFNVLKCDHGIARSVLHRFCIGLLFLMLFASFALGQERLVGLTSKGGAFNGGTAFSLLTNNTGFAVHTNFVAGGKYPEGDLTKGLDGMLYGMTKGGGNSNVGTLFKMTNAGAITILKSLDNTTGNTPYGSLILGSDGNFYGMTNQGGTSGYGTIFRYNVLANTITVLKHLLITTTGSNVQGSLVQGTDGFLYGMAYYGGTNNNGTIFKIKMDGTSFLVIKHLQSSTTGANPRGSLVQGSDGYFYGATTTGGTKNFGTIFKINATGSVFSVIKQLDNTITGRNSYGRMVQYSAGVFYGMMYQGGSSGNGLIFKIAAGVFSVIKSLTLTTGYNPQGSLIKGSDGLLYGMTYVGGSAGYGTIFKVNTTGSTFTVLKNLDAASGGYAKSGLVQGSDGAYYGMTNLKGVNEQGTIFRVTSAVGSFSLLLRFPEGGKGSAPQESLVQGKDGFFYGTASQGGTKAYGLLYRLCTNGSFTTLKNMEYATTGGQPEGSLIQGTDGNFYGMSAVGGSAGYGAIFKMTPGGTTNIIKSLSSATTGRSPYGSLVQGNDLWLYGMTFSGGTNNLGTVFKVKTDGSLFTVLKHLDNASGNTPYGSMIKAADGNLYGMLSKGGTNNVGTVFKITTATGNFTVLKSMALATGSYPYGNLVQGTDGNFYGMARQGGSSAYGTIFKLNATGTTLTVMKHLSSATTGGYPEGSLVQGSGGVLYGMTTQGGTNGGGTIFKITTATVPAFAVLRHLKPSTDGGTPLGSLAIEQPNPKAIAQSLTTAEDASKVITLTGTGGTPLSFTITTAPKNGTLSGTGAARTYTPKLNYFGKDSFYFTTTWGCQTSAVAKVNITITSVADLLTGTSTSQQFADILDSKVQPSGNQLSVRVLPNPSTSYFTLTVHSHGTSAVTMKVFDAMGRTIEGKSAITSNSTLRIGHNYRPGVYFAQMFQDGKVVTVKLLKLTP